MGGPVNEIARRFVCAECSKSFRTRNGMRAHMGVKHPAQPSMASLVASARVAYAMGERVDDDLLAMFPNDIRGER